MPSRLFRFVTSAFAVGLLSFLSPSAHAQAPKKTGGDEGTKPLDAKALTKLGRAATAYIEVTQPGKGLTSGSAFCVHGSGLFITNSHVVKGATGEIRLVLFAGTPEQKVLTAKVLRSDATEDMALLKVTEKGEYQALVLGDTDGLSELQTVVAFGFPFGNRLAATDKEYASITVNSLKISSLRNRAGKLYRIQLDGALNPGASGGPVLDEEGKVVGIVVSGIRGTGLAEAIPSTHARKLLATPTLSVSYPAVSTKDQGKPVAFEARVASFTATGKVEVELSLKAGEHAVKAPMTAKGDAFTANVIPLPADTATSVAATVTVDGAIIPLKIENRKFQAGSKSVEFKLINQISLTGPGEVTLADGTRLPGPISNLGEATANLAGQKLTFELGRASKIVFTQRETASAVECTVVVRIDGKEATREEHTIAVEGIVSTARPIVGQPGVISAPSLTADKTELPLPSTTDHFCVGGNGRYIILRLPKERKVAVFDATVAKIVKYLPLAEANAPIAAGLEKLYIALPNANAIQRYDLATFEKDMTAPVPPQSQPFSHMLMGSASRGPILVVTGEEHRLGAFFLDAATLKTVEFKNQKSGGRLTGLPTDPNSRVSADGTMFTWWGVGSEPNFKAVIVKNDTLTSVSCGLHLGHLSPSPDGKVVYTAHGAYTAEGKGLSGASDRAETYLIPAVHGRYFLRVAPSEWWAKKNPLGTVTLHIEGDTRPLVTLSKFEIPSNINPFDREMIGNDQRFMLLPSAKLLVYLPSTNDRLVLHKLDIDAAIESSGIDYLLVTSSPVTAVQKGKTYMYDVVVKAKKGGVKYKLESAPEGMKVDANGRLTWEVPGDFSGKAVDVLLTIIDAAGQEIFHSFQVAVE